MLGGGTFTSQNKILNGAYINFVSASKADATLSDRGIAAMPLELDWGIDNAVFEVTPAEFQKDSLKIFGYAYTHDKMKGMRDLFMNITKLVCYKLTSGGVKASNAFATAKYAGVRGNDINTVITANVDEPEKFDVKTYLGTTLVDEQVGVADVTELVANDFVDWKTTGTLELTAGTEMTGGTNGTVDGTTHSTAIGALEAYTFNTLGVITSDATTKALYVAFTKRMREAVGVKFQCVLHNYATADYEGIISVKNTPVTGNTADLVYWVTGAEAGCPINKTLLNQKYTGEYAINANYTQAQLESAMANGEFVFHNVNGTIRVLADINTLVSDTEDKAKEIFGENQSIRVMDAIATDIAALFTTKYLGAVPNDAAGRISLWNDIVKHHSQLQDVRAIEDFSPDDITVMQGEAKNSVVVGDAITIVNAMAKLYMTVTVQ